MKEKFLRAVANGLIHVAQLLFDAAHKEHLKKCPHHTWRAAKSREARMN